MGKQRTKSYGYDPSGRATKETYQPIPNGGLLKIRTDEHIAPEYQGLLPYVSDTRKIGNRVLYIVENSIIGISTAEDDRVVTADIFGNTHFILNALLANRNEKQSMIEIANFGEGFRGTHHERIGSKIATPLNRPIQALDDFAEQVTGEFMIWRNHYGSGNTGGEPTMYQIMEDIDVIDARNSTTENLQ